MDDALGAALAARRSEVLAACACTNLRKATRAVTQRFDTALRPSGLRATQLALLLTCAGPDDANLGEIAERLAVDRSTLSRTLQPLARRGLVTVDTGPTRRARRVTVTPAGHAALSAALALWAGAERSVAEEIGWPDLARLFALLTRLVPHGRAGGR